MQHKADPPTDILFAHYSLLGVLFTICYGLDLKCVLAVVPRMLTTNLGFEAAMWPYLNSTSPRRGWIEQIDFNAAEINEFISQIRQDSLTPMVRSLTGWPDCKPLLKHSTEDGQSSPKQAEKRGLRGIPPRPVFDGTPQSRTVGLRRSCPAAFGPRRTRKRRHSFSRSGQN